MGKFLSAVLVLVLAYFAFLKRTEPPKEVPAPKEQTEEQFATTLPAVVSSAVPTAVSAPVSATIAVAGTDSVLGDEGSLPDEADGSGELAKDEPKENVDQTVIANEKKLAAAKTGSEVLELLQKLRIRMKKLGEISTVANTQNYAKFFGTFEGPVVNRRNESVYTLKLEIKQNPDPQAAYINGSFDIDKAKDGKVKGYFNGDFGMQLVGRDGLVISDATESNNFQLYKLDNGMVAGAYYEKRKASYRVYKFILKKK